MILYNTQLVGENWFLLEDLLRGDTYVSQGAIFRTAFQG